MEVVKGLWVTYDKGKNYSVKNEKQVKETCMCVFLYLTYCIVSWWFTVLLLGEIRCQLVSFKVPLVAAISPYLILPTDPCMKCLMKPEIEVDHHTGNYIPLLFLTSVWVH